jgi:hypothetical protein
MIPGFQDNQIGRNFPKRKNTESLKPQQGFRLSGALLFAIWNEMNYLIARVP